MWVSQFWLLFLFVFTRAGLAFLWRSWILASINSRLTYQDLMFLSSFDLFRCSWTLPTVNSTISYLLGQRSLLVLKLSVCQSGCSFLLLFRFYSLSGLLYLVFLIFPIVDSRITCLYYVGGCFFVEFHLKIWLSIREFLGCAGSTCCFIWIISFLEIVGMYISVVVVVVRFFLSFKIWYFRCAWILLKIN